MQPLAGDASERSYYRLRPGGGQPSLILMQLPAADPGQGDLFCRQQELFRSAGLPVPAIYCHEPRRGIILLQDCGDLSLQRLVRQRGVQRCRDYYRQAIDWLLKLQAATFTLERNYPAFAFAFDAAKFYSELEFFLLNMVEGWRRQRIAPSDRRRIQEDFRRLAEILAAQPRYLTHRDYHSRNLMVVGERLSILDFQDARLGPCQYDLASLLLDSYVEIPDKMLEELKAYYLAQRARYEMLPPIQNFEQIFLLSAIQRQLKALGTFAFQALHRDNRSYLPYLAPTLRRLRRAFRRCPQFILLGELLGRYLPELR